MISAEGARNHGLLNVPTEEFFDTYHYITENPNEQAKISHMMALIEQRIEKQQSIVDKRTPSYTANLCQSLRNTWYLHR